MKSLMFYARRDIRIEETPKPVPAEDEVLIRVTDAGLSQTQINEFIEGPFIINTEPHPLTGVCTPMIPSQEYGGEIVEIGRRVSPHWLGKQVAVLPLISCGQCEQCQTGHIQLCPDKAYYGLVGAHGGFCEYSAVRVANVIEVGDKALLTFIEPLLVAIHALQRYGHNQNNHTIKDKQVLILGAGAIGLSCAALWQYMGAKQLFVYDPLPNRLKKAAECGLQVAEHPGSLTGKFDVVIDAAGKDPLRRHQAFEQAPHYLKPGGAVISVATYFFPMSVIPIELLADEKAHIPAFMYNLSDIDLLRQILPQLDFPFASLITQIAFEQLIQDGYYQAELDRDPFVRLVTCVR